MLNTANSQVYPRWGIGAEIGASSRLDAYKVFSPMGYAYTYGYVPGFMRTHGMKLTAMWQTKLREDSPFSQQVVDILPRGLNSNPSLGSHLSLYNSNLVKVTADYAIPIYIGELSIAGGLVYIKRLCLTPHADYTRAGNTDLFSVGSALTLDLNGIIWIDWPVSIGATYSYSGIGDYNLIKTQTGIDMKPHHFGFIFNVSF